MTRWHFGKKFLPGGKKKPFWMNRWLVHPCADLAHPFEVGVRAATHHDGAITGLPNCRLDPETGDYVSEPLRSPGV